MGSVDTARILIIDDDRDVRRVLKKTFRAEHYHFQDAATAAEGIRLAIRAEPDVVLLDPAGEEVLREIRKANPQVPIIVMSARAQERDKIRLLDAGADDFVSKPLAIGELLARIRVFLRKRAPVSVGGGPAVFRAGHIEVDSAKRRVLLDGTEVHLTGTEYRLMQVLIRHAD